MKSCNRTDYANCTRGLRYIILNQDNVYGQIWKYRKAFGEAFHEVSSYIFDNCNNLTTFNFKSKPECYDKCLHQAIKEIMSEAIGKTGIIKNQRNVVMAVLSNYASYKRRPRLNVKYQDRFPGSPIKLKPNKSIRFDDGGVTDKDGKLFLPGLNGTKISCSYYHPGTVSKNRKYISNFNSMGGTLFFESGVWRFTAQFSKPVFYKYIPQYWVGSDFGAKKDNFVVLVDKNGNTIERLDKMVEIKELEDKITKCNQTLNDRTNTKGGKRRYFNKLRKKLHKKHNRLIYKLVIVQIINKIQSLQCGLAIDDVATGDKKGTWGQDKLIPELIKQCENLGIPFFVTNPAYTSQTCPICNYIFKSNRKGEVFKCKNCGYFENADIVGARNNAITASKWYDENRTIYITNREVT